MKTWVVPVLVALVAGVLGFQVASKPARAGQSASGAQVERGRYLVSILGCGDCHTPFKMGPNGPEPDAARYLSGHPQGLAMPTAPKLDAPWGWAGALTNTAFAGPWGVSYAINLTPDELSGIGIWTEEIFVNAMRTGRHWGQSRPIMPPMPWQAYRNLTDDDVKAVYAYLRTVPSLRNRAPDYAPPAAPEEEEHEER